MGKVTNTIDLIDRMSEKLDAIANHAEALKGKFDDLERSASAAFDRMENNAQRAIQAMSEQVSEITAGLPEGALSPFEEALKEAEQSQEDLNRTVQEGTEALQAFSETGSESFSEAVRRSEDLGESIKEATRGSIEEIERGQGAFDNLASTGVQAISEIGGALVGIGITALLAEAADVVYELAEAFDEAESEIVRATGATGEALQRLTDTAMSVYADRGDLSTASALVGELNTRLDLTGEELRQAAERFYDFSRATGQNAVSSVRTVTQAMRQWELETADLEGMLDKLTVAGQRSGISLSTLSTQMSGYKDVFGELGFSLEEAIAMLSQFERYGVNAGSVMMGIRQAVAKGAVSSSEELFSVFDRLEAGTMSAAQAAEMFGTRAGNQIASAAKVGALELEELIDALERVDGATRQTAESATTASQKWELVGEKISAALTNAFSPALNRVSESLADKALAVFESFEIKTEPVWTDATRRQADELERLNAEYQKFVDAGRQEEKAASLLRYQIQKLEADYKSSAETMEGMLARHEALRESYYSSVESRAAESNALEQAELDYSALISRMEELTGSTSRTASETLELETIYDSLSSSLGGLSVSFDEITAGSGEAITSIQAYAEAVVAARKTESIKTGYVDQLEKVTELRKAAEEAENNYKLAAEDASRALLEYEQEYEQALLEYEEAYRAQGLEQFEKARYMDLAAAKLNAERLEKEAKQNYDAQMAALREAEEELARLGELWDEVAGTSETAVNGIKEGFLSVKGGLDELYDAAHESTNTFIDQTMGLFNQMETKTDLTVAQMMEAWASQNEWMAAYSENLEAVISAGLNTDLVSQLMDQGAAGANYLNEIMAEYARLGGATSEAGAKLIQELNEEFETNAAYRKQFGQGLEETSIKLSEEYEKMVQTAAEKIDGLNVAGQAEEAARATMDAYLDALIAGGRAAEDEATRISAEVAAALSNTEVSIRVSASGAIEHNAAGTVHSADTFVAGENGPELVVGHEGSTVFPASETERIVGAVNDYQNRVVGGLPEESAPPIIRSTDQAERTVNIKVEGAGNIRYSGVNKEEVLGMVQESMKPTLLDILQEEVFQEGDGTYDY